MQCNTPCCFVHHPKFYEELTGFISGHAPNTTIEETISNIERLLVKHFYLKNISFTPKHLGLAQGFSGFTVYWLHLVVPNSNVSRTQLPKAYFYRSDSHISFLCLDSHITNYKDSKLRRVAQERLEDIIEVLKTHNNN